MAQRRYALALAVAVAGWGCFALGILGQLVPRYRELAGSPAVWSALAVVPSLGPLALLVLSVLVWRSRSTWWPAIARVLDAHSDALDAIPAARLGPWILLAAGVGLFCELMMIRVHASFFQLFAYFKNASLLSCFVGLGIGYARSDSGRVMTPLVLPMLAFQIALLHALRLFGAGEFLRNPIAEQAAMGLDPLEGAAQAITVYGFLIAVFATNALCFVPLGHAAARLMSRCERLSAYGWNLAGSIAGIALFSALSFAWTPPSLWILALVAGLLPLLRPRVERLVSAVAAGALVALLAISVQPGAPDLYSPYQIVSLRYERGAISSLAVNDSYFQRLLDLRPEALGASRLRHSWANYYGIPYRFAPAPERVLVVGAGTGNDVAAALRHGALHVDAVEIDPAILAIGRAAHPEAPYASPRVETIVDDARSFVRRARSQYDVIVYGLLDSHTLLAGLTNVRLDSYVYTVEALREARARLAPEGVLSLSFSLPTPELGVKLFRMLAQVFDGVPPRAVLSYYDASVTFVAGGSAGGGTALPEGLVDVSPTFADSSVAVDVSTDDWPFLYMPLRTYPRTYVGVVGALLLVSFALIRALLPRVRGRVSLPCFFLGAGFMLLETKAITELALVFGSTWLVVSAVLSAILLLGFCANALIARIRRPHRGVAYALLLASLAISWRFSGFDLAGLPPGLGRLLLTLILTLPLFFAGLAFSTELGTGTSVSAALSANLLGAVVGGLLEYNSMVLGFGALSGLALGAYALAAASSVLSR
jgi:spermidine synthase